MGCYRTKRWEPCSFNIALIDISSNTIVKGSYNYSHGKTQRFQANLTVDPNLLSPGLYMIVVIPEWNENPKFLLQDENKIYMQVLCPAQFQLTKIDNSTATSILSQTLLKMAKASKLVKVSPTIEGLMKFECSEVGASLGSVGFAIKYFVNKSSYNLRVEIGAESRDVKLINRDVTLVDLPASNSEVFWFGYRMQTRKSGLKGWKGNHKIDFY